MDAGRTRNLVYYCKVFLVVVFSPLIYCWLVYRDRLARKDKGDLGLVCLLFSFVWFPVFHALSAWFYWIEYGFMLMIVMCLVLVFLRVIAMLNGNDNKFN